MERPSPRTSPLKSSLAFTGVCLVFVAAICLTWWLRDHSLLVGLSVLALMVVPLAAAWLWVSLSLPHGAASWKALLPGTLLVAVGFQALHAALVYFLLPKLEKATTLYGGLGVVATVLFFAYLVGRIVVTAPILNSTVHEELRRKRARTLSPSAAPAGVGGAQHGGR